MSAAGMLQIVKGKVAHSKYSNEVNTVPSESFFKSQRTIDGILNEEQLTAHSGTQQQNKHWLIDNHLFEAIVFITIISNCIQMGLAVDNPEWTEAWKITEHVFTSIFAAEMFLKLGILKKDYFSKGWNRLDFVLVTISVLDNWIIGFLFSADTMMSRLAVFRVLRICRVARMVRLFKVFKELFIILMGIFDSLRTVLWVVLLLAFVLYVCSILCVEIMGRKDAYPGFDDSEEAIFHSEEVAAFNNFIYFGSIPRSMFTLFCVVLTAEFDAFGRPMIEMQPYMTLFFLGFVIFTTFGVLNVIVGVIVDNVAEAERNTQSEMDHQLIERKLGTLEQLRQILFSLDANHDGAISLEELEEGWSDPEFQKLLQTIGLPKGWTPQELMWLLDVTGDHAIQFDDFIKTFYRLLFCTDSFQQNCCLQVSMGFIKFAIQEFRQETSKALQKISDRDRLEQKFRQDTAEALKKISDRLENIELHSGASKPIPQVSENVCHKGIDMLDSTYSGASKSIPQVSESVCQKGIDMSDAADEKNVWEGIDMSDAADEKNMWARIPTNTASADLASNIVQFEVNFSAGVLSLGFEVEWTATTPVVGNVEGDGPANLRGVRTGDLILAVHGNLTKGRSRQEMLPLFKVRPLILRIARASEHKPADLELDLQRFAV